MGAGWHRRETGGDRSLTLPKNASGVMGMVCLLFAVELIRGEDCLL